MHPYYGDAFEQLRQTRARAAELEEAWRTANPRRSDTRPGYVPGPVFTARATAGRALIELGRRLLPANAEPCS